MELKKSFQIISANKTVFLDFLVNWQSKAKTKTILLELVPKGNLKSTLLASV